MLSARAAAALRPTKATATSYNWMISVKRPTRSDWGESRGDALRSERTGQRGSEGKREKERERDRAGIEREREVQRGNCSNRAESAGLTDRPGGMDELGVDILQRGLPTDSDVNHPPPMRHLVLTLMQIHTQWESFLLSTQTQYTCSLAIYISMCIERDFIIVAVLTTCPQYAAKEPKSCCVS